ncbi:MAG: tryptophanase [Firmicutes bacterium]|nr:tryptophanase [Bacillota bacterium]MCL5040102.1 tryptophanase [Bacillota bacterium]
MRPRDEYAEPYRIKVVEPLRQRTREEREELITQAGYNLFSLRAEDVYIDLLTDSGTSAMSDNQWAGIMLGDESYAGSKSFYHLEESVREIMGFRHVVPTHQGRAAEHILMTMLVKPSDRVLGNMHFDTTEGHILLKRATPVNLVIEEGYEPSILHPFKGNIDLFRLEEELDTYGPEKIPFVLITVTCNNNGGQPVSMANIRAVREIASRYGVPVFFDAARFAENAFFIKEREPGYADKPVAEIVREMFSYGDGCTMSSKKDGLVNIGGLLAFNSEGYYRQAVQWGIVYEGFATYGGQAGRDLEALSRGLREVVDEYYLENRIGQVDYLARRLLDLGIPIIEPPGGHGVYLDARRFLPHIPQEHFPAQTLAAELYIEGGIRGVELGTNAFAHRDEKTGEIAYPRLELVRLAIPRRVYTDRHMDQVARALAGIARRKDSLHGLRMVYEAPVLRHFTSRFERL